MTRVPARRRAHARALVAAVVGVGLAIAFGVAVLLSDGAARNYAGSPQPLTFPSPTDTGPPAGWEPRETVHGDVRIGIPGTTVEDLRIIDGSLLIDAPDVTVRRVEIRGGVINNYPAKTCGRNLLVEDTAILPSARAATTDQQQPAIGPGGYTARGVLVDGIPEGLRVGESEACGPVSVEDSFIRATAPDVCGDWHGDALQGYDGGQLTVRKSTLVLTETGDCGGTAAFFYPSGQGNSSVVIDELLVMGGGYPFRLGTHGTVDGLKIVEGTWGFAPIDVRCSIVAAWDAAIVRLVAPGEVKVVSQYACSTESGT